MAEKSGAISSPSPAFFRVFVVQGIINFIVGSASYVVIKYNEFSFDSAHRYFVYAALFIALVGLFFEVVGDEQLRQHINKKHAHFCKQAYGQSHVIQTISVKF